MFIDWLHEMIDNGIRIDKWLWAARFFKSRQLAQEAITGGKVNVYNQRVKPSKIIHIHDELSVRRGHFVYEITVKALSEKRLAATIAQTLYEEHAESIDKREAMSLQLKAQSLYTPKTDRRPDKKSRRQLITIKKT